MVITKKQSQKNRRCPLQQVEGVGQDMDQEQVTPATTRLFTKCYVEGCSFDTIQEIGEWDHVAQCSIPQDPHNHLLVMHIQGEHMNSEKTPKGFNKTCNNVY